MTSTSRYRGRFAPSPTGPLHLGSLVAALASYLDAKANHGQWLVRMEDLDPPRESPGAATAILASLQAHGLYWDETVLWQSLRHQAYQQAIDRLLASNQAFYCSCSRRDLIAGGGIHSGNCRQSTTPPSHCAVRLAVPPITISHQDSIQGSFSQPLLSEVGDFVLKRKDGLFAYQLAVVVDDAHQRISHCVRGSDLLDSTPRQIFLQQSLGLATMQYSHIPILINQQRQKLSKQNHALPLDDSQPGTNLLQALQLLRQTPPPPTLARNNRDILQWAVAHWTPASIPGTLTIAAPC